MSYLPLGNSKKSIKTRKSKSTLLWFEDICDSLRTVEIIELYILDQLTEFI